MREAFFELSARLQRELRGGEILLLNLAAERSDFVRFNHSKVRQAGSVEQRTLSLRLIRDRRQASATVALGEDTGFLNETVQRLRDTLETLPEDPWLLINESPQSTSSERRGVLAPADEVVNDIVGASRGRDLVGFYAGGTICRGFTSSLGQRNWHEVDSFNFDCSLYLRDDKAVKTGYAGFEWDARAVTARLEAAAKELKRLDQPSRTLDPGEYRAYLSPRALEEITGMLCWGGFSLRSRKTRQSPLLRLEEGAALSPILTMLENTGGGIAPGYQGDGFIKPPAVTLIRQGQLGDALVSPRSAKEYGLKTNAANGRESPESIEVSTGTLDAAQALKALDRGLFISNLWYLNFSDRPAGRITGMTRFATFWVEGGRIVAPVTPMRFDDSIYRILGEQLVDLTRERELLLDPSTYGERSTSSSRLPGALLGRLRFTL